MDKSKVGKKTLHAVERNIGADSLCSTCNYIAACAYRERSDCPIIYCEEFEASNVPQVRILGAGDISHLDSPVRISRTGLCVNCDNIAGCNYSRLDEGVWHCEEYS